MNTEEIDRVLRYHVRDFVSVDTLPDKPRLLMCNTDASDKPGRHWICMHFEAGSGEYFDSFGRRPTANFERYLNRHCSSWTFNRRQLHSVITEFCERYYQKSGFSPRGDSLHRFRSNFAVPTYTWVRLAVQNFTSVGPDGWEYGPKISKISTFW